VAVEGKLRYSSWERDGQKRSKLEVIVDDLEFMSSRGDNQGGYGNNGYNGGYGSQGYQPQPQQAPVPAPMPVAQPDVSSSVYDEDIPF
jgi:single-strand DNA-binding protein